MTRAWNFSAGTDYPGKDCGTEGPTIQSAKPECDINNIVRKYEKTGVLPVMTTPGMYMDVSEVGDYREALEKVEVAQGVFGNLPSDVRTAFDNDPAAFLDAVNSEEGRDKLEELGISLQMVDGETGEIVKAPEASSSSAPPEGAGQGDEGAASE